MSSNQLKNFKNRMNGLFSNIKQEKVPIQQPQKKKSVNIPPRKEKGELSNKPKIRRAKPPTLSETDKQLMEALKGNSNLSQPIESFHIVDKKELERKLEKGEYLPPPKPKEILQSIPDEDDHYDEILKEKTILNKKKIEQKVNPNRDIEKRIPPQVDYAFKDRPTKTQIYKDTSSKKQHENHNDTDMSPSPNNEESITDIVQGLYGRKRNYSYFSDDDLDDMEATAEDIKREEARR
eukprot:NODE_8_length_66115_cov_0.981823.p31 type:complete len:236 gc:universal NODE_8_length_66115_cov_0.981823:32604-31897(-)